VVNYVSWDSFAGKVLYPTDKHYSMQLTQ